MGLFSGIANIFKDVTGAIGDVISPISDIISPFSGLIGAAGSVYGAQQTNDKNLEIAREQMDFQRDMSNTAYQRGTADMEAAGLNPMLAYQQGGASSPSGASIAMQNPFAGITSAIQAGAGSALANAQTENVKADTLTKLANLPSKQLQGDFYDKARTLLKPFLHDSKSSASSHSKDASSQDILDIFDPGHSASAAESNSDSRSALHKFIDSIGEWNPYGLGSNPFQ
jgi:hypothetical protein